MMQAQASVCTATFRLHCRHEYKHWGDYSCQGSPGKKSRNTLIRKSNEIKKKSVQVTQKFFFFFVAVWEILLTL